MSRLSLASDVSAPASPDKSARAGQLRRALPSFRTAVVGGLLWGLAMALSAAAGLHADGWHSGEKVRTVVVLFLFGGFLAFAPAVWISRVVSQEKPAQTAFAAFFVILGVVTIGLASAIFALQYRIYYSEWHAGIFTKTWLLQLIFTSAAALYQFAVLGLRLFVPFGPIALFAAALWFARRQR